MNKIPSIQITEVVQNQTECTSGRTEIIVTESLSNTEDLQLYPCALKNCTFLHRKITVFHLITDLHLIPTCQSPQEKCQWGGREVHNSLYVSKCSTSRKHCNKAVEEVAYRTVMHENRGEVTLENQNLPFVKSYHFWENLEFRNAFHLTLQRPHFRTLLESDEWLREGQALGYMLSFVDILKALGDLKPFGFNVRPVCARVGALLGIQDTQVELDERLKEIEEKLIKEMLAKI